jgi:MFS family permease
MPSQPTEQQPSREFLLVIAAFVALGIMFGSWQVLVVEQKLALGLSDAQLGGAIAIGTAGAYPALFLGGRVVDRYGAAALVAAAGVLAALGFALLGVARDAAAFAGLLLAFFAAAGAYDVAINTAGMHFEQRHGRRVMPVLHAGYSGGAVLGAVAAGLLLQLGVAFRAVFVLAAGVAVVVALAVHLQRSLFADGERLKSGLPQRGRGVRAFHSATVWWLAAITGLCFFGEGAVETWSALYLREHFGAAVIVAAAGPAVFHAAMFAGRLASAAVVARCGPYTTLRTAGALCALGISLALASHSVALTLCGWLVAGLALAAIAPQAFSIAGDHAGGRGGEASSLITMVGYSGFLFGPALIGGLAELFGLRAALASLIVAGFAISVIALRLRGASQRAVLAAPK